MNHIAGNSVTRQPLSAPITALACGEGCDRWASCMASLHAVIHGQKMARFRTCVIIEMDKGHDLQCFRGYSQ